MGEPELIGRGIVLANTLHGPQLCLGGITASMPPQCGGPDIPNWDWDAVDGHTTFGGTTFGGYVVAGIYDPHAGTFTLTRPGIPADEYTGPSLRYEPADPDLRTPCPEPAGGWSVLDPGTTTEDALEETAGRAASMPGYAGLWVDQSRSSNPEGNDPTQLVLNVTFTDDLTARETDLRATWGGALCVSKAAQTEAELARIQHALRSHPGMLFSNGDPTGNTVRVAVIYDDGTWQQDLDHRYGPGVVAVTSALRPYDGQLEPTS